MKKHYTIAFPNDHRLPILLFDYHKSPPTNRKVSLQEVKDAVFKAVLQDCVIFLDTDLRSNVIADAITIIDREEHDRAFAGWKMLKPDGTVLDQ